MRPGTHRIVLKEKLCPTVSLFARYFLGISLGISHRMIHKTHTHSSKTNLKTIKRAMKNPKIDMMSMIILEQTVVILEMEKT